MRRADLVRLGTTAASIGAETEADEKLTGMSRCGENCSIPITWVGLPCPPSRRTDKRPLFDKKDAGDETLAVRVM